MIHFYFNYLKIAICLLCVLGFPRHVFSQTQKPNILILLADDMGYGDLGCYGGHAATPNLDQLAEGGIRFTQCYAGAPNCSPSRVSLLTGRIPARAGMYSYRPPKHVMHLPQEEITIAEVLKNAGYQTAHIGKWHLGSLTKEDDLMHPQPHEQGFDYSLGTENNAVPSHLNPTNFVRNGEEVGETEGYACQLLANEVEHWFDHVYNKNQAFFLYLPFHEPHAKIASPPGLIAKYEKEFDKKTAAYLANIEHLDQAIGRVLKTLATRGLQENTLVFFASDNGSYRMGSNGKLRGLKGEIYDGGIKVPGIFSFPGKFEGGREISEPIWFQDLFPTLASLADAELPDDVHLDGTDLLPLLKNGQSLNREQAMLWFFYRSSPELSMRMGDWSLVARVNDTTKRTHWLADKDMPFIKSLEPEYFELYNLNKDPGQKNDLSAQEPGKLETMKIHFQELLKSVREEGPSWEGLPAYNPKRANHDKVFEFLRNQKRFLH